MKRLWKIQTLPIRQVQVWSGCCTERICWTALRCTCRCQCYTQWNQKSSFSYQASAEQGQSLYVICQYHPEIKVTERTLYTYIEDGVFQDAGVSITNLDIKKESTPQNSKEQEDPVCKASGPFLYRRKNASGLHELYGRESRCTYHWNGYSV